MSKIALETITNEKSISEIMELCSPYFHNQKVNNKEIISQLARKYSTYGCVIRGLIEGNTVGFCAYYANDFTNKCAYLSMIVVLPVAQGKGVGTALLIKMIEDCKLKKMKKILLEVADDNNRAIQFYKKNKFHIDCKKAESTSQFLLEL